MQRTRELLVDLPSRSAFSSAASSRIRQALDCYLDLTSFAAPVLHAWRHALVSACRQHTLVFVIPQPQATIDCDFRGVVCWFQCHLFAAVDATFSQGAEGWTEGSWNDLVRFRRSLCRCSDQFSVQSPSASSDPWRSTVNLKQTFNSSLT